VGEAGKKDLDRFSFLIYDNAGIKLDVDKKADSTSLMRKHSGSRIMLERAMNVILIRKRTKADRAQLWGVIPHRIKHF
jgi:hypothetical protein